MSSNDQQKKRRPERATAILSIVDEFQSLGQQGPDIEGRERVRLARKFTLTIPTITQHINTRIP